MSQPVPPPPVWSRSLPLQGIQNFRDLGGYIGHEGRPVKWRKIFRSGHLAHATAQDRHQLQSLGVRHVLDFRGVEESAAAVCGLDHVQLHALSIEPTVHYRLEERARQGGVMGPEEVTGFMRETYENFVLHNSARFKQLFDVLLGYSEPLVFHCTYGKDRTGLAAVLVLHSLGVDAATIEQDYLLTNQLLNATPRLGKVLSEEAQRVLLGVQSDFLEASLATIQAHYGTVDQYLDQAIGINPSKRQQLRSAYLE